MSLVRRNVFDASHEAFRERVRGFLAEEVVPSYADWERTKRPPREFWRRAGEVGILGIGVPAEYGGVPGSGFKHSVVVTEEAQAAGLALGGVRVHTDICMPYVLAYATDDQKARWLPRLTSGDAVIALAMSEPGAGSDMKAMSARAKREGDHYVVNGAKTFISNGLAADLMIVACKTDPDAGPRGISLLMVEAEADGFGRGAAFDKIGLRAQDLSELFFDDVRVPAANLLGEENRGFDYLTANLAKERLSIAINSQAAAAAALGRSVDALRSRNGSVGQHAKFELAACAVEIQAGQALVDAALEAAEAGDLTVEDAAAAKLYCTELQGRVVDRCLQLHGTAGYSRSSPIGRAYADARVSRIYGGSSEIMKVIVAKSIGL